MQRPTEAYIPPNLNNNGGLAGGMFKMRNLVEAGIFVVIDVILCLILKMVLPGMACLIIGIIIGLIGVVLCVAGINGEPISSFFLTTIRYKNTKAFLEIQMPMPETAKIKNREDKAKEGLIEKLLGRLMYGKENN